MVKPVIKSGESNNITQRNTHHTKNSKSCSGSDAIGGTSHLNSGNKKTGGKRTMAKGELEEIHF